MMLDVHVSARLVAKLYRERDEYILKYLPDTAPEDFVSLTMPVREEAWRWPRDLFPFFRQNLPEGYLLSVIREEFGPLLDGTDLSLLAVVGGTGIGRVSITPEGVRPGVEMAPLEIEHLLKTENTSERFATLVRQYARVAISGVVPKFIAADTAGTQEPLGKPTLRTGFHIIKGSDDTTPFLGFNEFYTMRVLARLNVVPVAACRMSEDGKVLVVDRFDVDDRGIPRGGVEDACGLLGLPPHEKYAPTTERLWNATRPYIPADRLQTQREHLGWQLLTNYVVRNSDCHAKNIALLYTSRADVVFTPVYDLVTTQAYPRFASNPPGLSIGGRKTWTPGRSVETFFKAVLGISPRQYAAMVEQLCESAVAVGKEVIEASKNEPAWRDVAKHMVHAWNEGMETLRSSKAAPHFRGLDTFIEEAGLSGPSKLERSRDVIGRSELLAKKR
ncbi:type II toxin-antitoxin system HipA family toxin [Pseudomonas viridiflava]|uniref:type II toxin-antitoxin system HipA family toxin n=1 Tax=Pseudomonas viridiflava TaxID=33069 RepID=UPI00211D7BF6|nr:type II toxin-antitoxin system HipA family toxin [Pseudomonas viridiflava]MCQ9393000.1 type II toxin-antitoxin system HipA family toxin [Pseudomonas viridiflava]MEE4133223.1 type II toxin-antitoxin system HipA family toxin [Pseudomonas viridiflava]MEE4157373.1 type II toxin-antitoxin system HipA family toxin [Pseudomonas viridiflava]